MLVNFKIIETINEYTDVISYYIKSPAPFFAANRSFCQQRILRPDFPEKDNLTMLFRSIEHDDCPLEKGNFVRSHTYISGYIFQ